MDDGAARGKQYDRACRTPGGPNAGGLKNNGRACCACGKTCYHAAGMGNVQIRRPVLLLIACGGLLSGLVLARVWSRPGWWWAGLLFVVPLLRWRTVCLYVVVGLLGFGAGWVRGDAYQQQLATYQPLWLRNVTVVAQAADDSVYGTHSQITFGADHVRLAASAQPLVGSWRVSGFGVSKVFRGDVVAVSGKLYPARGNNQASIGFAQLHVLAHRPGLLDGVRRRFVAGMQTALPEPLASFGLGLLIGQRSTLPPDVSQQLLAVGLTHIIAVSGYNLTIMVRAVQRLLGKRSVYQTTVTCLALIAMFVTITGSSASIVRAAIVSTLSILAWHVGRTVRPMVLLCFAATLSAFVNPLYVWGNVSWYLSFLAFFGVLVLAPLAAARVRRGGLLVNVLLESLCAELCTMPYVLHIFGQVSLVSLPANLLVAVLVPLAMLLALVAGLAGMAVPLLAGWAAWPAVVLLTYMLDMAAVLGRVPHAFVQGVGLSAAGMGTLYTAVGVGTWTLRRKTAQKHGIITDRESIQTEGV